MVFRHIVDKTMVNFDGHVSTGLVGIRHLMQGLTRHGRADIALRLATNRDYPSWGYMVEKGATTIWELWNGDTADPAMNSGNHVMLLGDLIAWCYEDLAGIRNADGAVAFRRIVLKPLPGRGARLRRRFVSFGARRYREQLGEDGGRLHVEGGDSGQCLGCRVCPDLRPVVGAGG